MRAIVLSERMAKKALHRTVRDRRWSVGLPDHDVGLAGTQYPTHKAIAAAI